MKLTINTDLWNQNLINNHDEFITFLDNYFILDDNYLQSKYKLNQLAIYIYQELEKDNKFIFQKTKKISHESKIFKTNYSVNYKCILSDSLIQRLNLSKYHTMQDIYFTKKKISRKGDYLFKSFTFHQDNYLAYFAILNEIVLQIYANYLSLGNNSFYVPLIWEVRKEITKHNDIKIDIIMDFVHENKVSDTTQLQYSICDALARLEEFNLYHNDTLDSKTNCVSNLPYGPHGTTATNGREDDAASDYISSSGTLIFEEGVTSKTVSVRILDDICKDPETIEMRIHSVSTSDLHPCGEEENQ